LLLQLQRKPQRSDVDELLRWRVKVADGPAQGGMLGRPVLGDAHHRGKGQAAADDDQQVGPCRPEPGTVAEFQGGQLLQRGLRAS
jgi:hypothetical protein